MEITEGSMSARTRTQTETPVCCCYNFGVLIYGGMETRVASKKRMPFTISAMFAVTFLVAVHCAFPFLINAFFVTLLTAVLLLCFPFGPVYMAAALFSEQKGNHLDVDQNKFCVIWNRLFVGVVCVVYFGMVFLFGVAWANSTSVWI